MDSEAANHIDLLSALIHEFGHHLGLVDVEDLTKALGGQLEIGVRQLDFSHDELFADPDALAELRS